MQAYYIDEFLHVNKATEQLQTYVYDKCNNIHEKLF